MSSVVFRDLLGGALPYAHVNRKGEEEWNKKIVKMSSNRTSSL